MTASASLTFLAASVALNEYVFVREGPVTVLLFGMVAGWGNGEGDLKDDGDEPVQ